jgi:hypothetical protein
MNNAEIWKDIPGYEGIYQVSNMGNVKSLSREKLHNGKYPITTNEKILKPGLGGNGYLILTLHKNNLKKSITIHMLVAMAFLNHKPNGTNKICIDHINNIKTDNRLVNLQLISQRENTSKDKKNGTSKYVGVCWKKSKNKFEVQIKVDGKNKYLGLFTDEYEAHLVYQKALKMYHEGDLSFMKPKEFSSQYKGVCWDKKSNKWRVDIKVDGKLKYLGTFTDEYEAHLAYQKALNEYQNKFAH